MKSSKSDLQKRGYALVEDVQRLSGLPQDILIEKLHSCDAVIRTSAANNLLSMDEIATCELLRQLAIEKCLYTKIAICESLERGNYNTAVLMTEYLSKIGNNQYVVLPNKVSAKKSFPLPRDIVARSLGKMEVSVFPALIAVLYEHDMAKIYEVLDAIGFMVFYHPVLATAESVKPVFSLIDTFSENQMVLWKVILCLSAFPLPESETVLRKYVLRTDILGMEARRSLNLLELLPSHSFY
ncbi:MAG: hypothetical protein ACYDEX_00745 [Mobilitalea sp.]